MTLTQTKHRWDEVNDHPRHMDSEVEQAEAEGWDKEHDEWRMLQEIEEDGGDDEE